MKGQRQSYVFKKNTHVRVDEASKQRLPHYEKKANDSMRCSCSGTNNDDSHYLYGAIVGCREPFLAQCWLTEELNSDEGEKKNSAGSILPLSLYLHLPVSHSPVSEVMQ